MIITKTKKKKYDQVCVIQSSLMVFPWEKFTLNLFSVKAGFEEKQRQT